MKLHNIFLLSCKKRVLDFALYKNIWPFFASLSSQKNAFLKGILSETFGNRIHIIFYAVFFTCLLSTDSEASENNTQGVPADYLISLVRHGDRSPVDLGDMARYWPKGPGQLTALGFQQEYLLGQQIRKHYFRDTLPEVWSPKVSKHVAKGLDRTIQSAYALLQGMYPKQSSDTGLPEGLQLPPVYAQPPEKDTLFFGNRICPGYLYRINELGKSIEWSRKKDEYRELLSVLSDDAKHNVSDNLSWLTSLADRIYIHRKYNLPIPGGHNVQRAKEIESLANWIVSKIYADYEIAQIVSGPLVEQLIGDFKQVNRCLKETNNVHLCQRWTLYSASDSNLMALMTLLGAPSDRIFEYATHIGIQLNWNAGQPVIALSLNHKPVSVPGCSGSCSLDQWLVILEKSLPHDWDFLCERKQSS